MSKYPLQIRGITTIPGPTRLDNIPWLRDRCLNVCSNPSMQARGIKDGDLVRVFNDRGTVGSVRVTKHHAGCG